MTMTNANAELENYSTRPYRLPTPKRSKTEAPGAHRRKV